VQDLSSQESVSHRRQRATLGGQTVQERGESRIAASGRHAPLRAVDQAAGARGGMAAL